MRKMGEELYGPPVLPVGTVYYYDKIRMPQVVRRPTIYQVASCQLCQGGYSFADRLVTVVLQDFPPETILNQLRIFMKTDPHCTTTSDLHGVQCPSRANDLYSTKSNVLVTLHSIR